MGKLSVWSDASGSGVGGVGCPPNLSTMSTTSSAINAIAIPALAGT
jgi:hypothetical protein